MSSSQYVFISIFVSFHNVKQQRIWATIETIQFVGLTTGKQTPQHIIRTSITIRKRPMLSFQIMTLATRNNVLYLVDRTMGTLKHAILAYQVTQSRVTLRGTLTIFVRP